jgi:hypothetical protein
MKRLGTEELIALAVYFNRAKPISFLLTGSEFDKLRERARREGLTVQRFIQRIVLDSLEDDSPPFWKR